MYIVKITLNSTTVSIKFGSGRIAKIELAWQKVGYLRVSQNYHGGDVRKEKLQTFFLP